MFSSIYGYFMNLFRTHFQTDKPAPGHPTTPTPPTVTSPANAVGTDGTVFNYQITATQTPTKYGATGLPPGLSVNATTGLISGTPTTAGTIPVTISAANAGGTGHQTLTLVLSAPTPKPTITSLNAATGQDGVSFTYTITASNSPTSYGTSGLPAGLTVDMATGIISGTPTVFGSFSATMTASNGSGTGSSPLTLTIHPPTPVISSASTASGTVGTGFSYSIVASNSPTSYTATGLPTGLLLNASTGVISGTPTAAATSTVLLGAVNAGGTGTLTLTLTVAAAPSTGPYNLAASEAFWDSQVSANGVENFPASKTWALLGLYFGTTQKTLNYIIPFKLPYLAPGQTITGATLSVDYLAKSGSPVSSIDVYGMARTSTSAAPVPLGSDFYYGANDTANTRVMQNLITPSTSTGVVTCSTPAFVTWLRAQYSAVGAGGTVFIRLSAQGLESLPSQNGFNIGYEVANPVPASPRSPNTPTLQITTSGVLSTDAGKLVFSFTLASPVITSAGVFDNSTGALLRTLWNNVPYATGVNYSSWDGKDDLGNTVAAGTYKIKLMTHNFAPVWEGVVGNTSTTNTGNNVFRSYYPPLGMAIDTATGIAYFCTGYSELLPNFVTFNGSAPQTCNFTTLSNNNGNANATFGLVATDGNILYWAKGAGGVSPALTYVLGMNMSGTAFTTFSSGTTISASPGTQMVTNALDVDSTSGQPNPASGLAVQKTGSYLFIAHNTLNVINVLNKTTGAAVTTIAVTAPGSLACDPTGNLYVVSGTSVLQYTINAGTGAGTLAHTWTGFTAPMAVGCDTGTTLGVVDGGTSQQVKLFNNSTFAAITTFGTAGGNDVNGPAINNSTFMFGVRTNSNTDMRTGIAFDASGGFWVIDNGNFRMMHYSVSGATVTYVEQIAYTTVSYVCGVDANDPTRVFNQYLEYAIDYTKTLDNGVNGSWTLVKNWFAGLSNTDYNVSDGGILSPATLSNGRTYALISNNTTGLIDVVELTSTGIRQCGASYGGSGNPVARIHADGSLHLTKSGSTGNLYTPQVKALTGFDGSNNPVWGTATNLLSWTPGTNDPQPFNQTKYPTTSTYTTDGGIIPILDNGITGTGFHLAGIPSGGSATKWRAARTPSAGTSYNGRFPSDGGWDIGNSVNYAGNSYQVWGNYIIVGYHGENWGANQAGRFMVYRDDGLFVGVFGVPGKYYQGTNTFAGAGFSGNASSPFVITNPTSGLATLYVNDESMHGGTHRWSLAALATTDLVGTGTIGQKITLA